jgi:hypothetical protein
MTRPVKHITYLQYKYISQYVRSYVEKYSVHSVFDIGAGHPLLASEIAQSVLTYRGIECDKLRQQELQRTGLDVLYGTFPIAVTGHYDLVLASHSLPDNDYQEFLECAWQLVNPSGAMLVITFKGSKGEIGYLRAQIVGDGLISTCESEGLYTILSQMGSVKVGTFDSVCRSKDLQAMVDFIEPWIYAPRFFGRYRKQLKLLIERRYRVNKSYVIPIQHNAVACHKLPVLGAPPRSARAD